MIKRFHTLQEWFAVSDFKKRYYTKEIDIRIHETVTIYVHVIERKLLYLTVTIQLLCHVNCIRRFDREASEWNKVDVKSYYGL